MAPFWHVSQMLSEYDSSDTGGTVFCDALHQLSYGDKNNATQSTLVANLMSPASCEFRLKHGGSAPRADMGFGSERNRLMLTA